MAVFVKESALQKKSAKRKIAQKKAVGSCVPHDRKDEFVIVGNYKDKQLAWTEKNGVYNYPVREGDEFNDDALRAVKELWLFADVKSTRHAFAVKGYVGKMTKAAFVAKYPTYKRPTHDAYYVFEVTKLDYEPTVNTEIVIARTADFGGRRTAKIRKAIEQFKADGEYGPLAAYLPKPLTQVPPKQLRVSEEAVQTFVWTPVKGMTPQQEKIESIVSSVAEFGRARSMPVAKAYQYLCAYAGLDFLDDHYSISRCYSDEMIDESLAKVCRNHGGTEI